VKEQTGAKTVSILGGAVRTRLFQEPERRPAPPLPEGMVPVNTNKGSYPRSKRTVLVCMVLTKGRNKVLRRSLILTGELTGRERLFGIRVRISCMREKILLLLRRKL
jgi:hypothetical protein